MCVSLQWLIQLAPALATLGAASFGLLRGEGKLRRELESDVQMAKDLPDTFEGKKILMDHIETGIKKLHARETAGRRDWPGAMLGVVFALGFGYGTLWLFKHPEWWRWFGLLTGLMAVIGLGMIGESLEIKDRDSKPERQKAA